MSRIAAVEDRVPSRTTVVEDRVPSRITVRRRWRLPIGLRFTLVLAMLPLLAMPVITLRYAEVMTELARNERLENQAQAARNLAASLHERRDLFEAGLAGKRLGIEPLPVELLADVIVDQDPGEWLGLPGRALPFRSPEGTISPLAQVRLAAARSQERPGRFFLLVEVDDERLVRPELRDGVELAGDELVVEYGAAPDTMSARRVQAVERPGGWLAEIGLDEEPALLRVRVADVDYLGSRRLEGRADSGLLAPVRRLAAGADDPRRAARWSEAVRGFARASGRVSVFDAGGVLLAQSGQVSAGPPPAEDWQARLARRLLAATRSLQAQRFLNDAASHAAGDDVSTMTPLTRALSGLPARQSERVAVHAGLPVWLLSSAQPIWVDDHVAGALVIEENTGSRFGAGRAAIEQLTLLSAAAMAASALALLAIGSITVARIVRLRRQAEQAIDSRGRVVGSIAAPILRDEIGALAESHARVLDRLREHQQYVGRLRARLVHELRTPIMVVRSSLDNLAAEADPQRRDAYLARVRDGAQRLERLVASMGEAASLETMLAGSRLETVELDALLGACAEAYRGAFSPRRFIVECEVGGASCRVVPEAIVQALDKLVSNASDFATPQTPIVLSLRRISEPAAGAAWWQLAVRNQGPPLPATMRENLFDSMVSVREQRAGDDAHLGLGLYLVRLVAEFHGGRAFAHDVAGGVEAGFLLRGT